MDIHEAGNREKLKLRLRAEFASCLEEKGLRQTAGRFLILDKCVDQRAHFGIQRLYDVIRGEYSVSLASVYKTVELLCGCNILRKHYLREHEAVYELAGEEHLHLICMKCGDVAVLESDEFIESQTSRMRDVIASGHYRSFCPAYITANVYGLCGTCRARV